MSFKKSWVSYVSEYGENSSFFWFLEVLFCLMRKWCRLLERVLRVCLPLNYSRRNHDFFFSTLCSKTAETFSQNIGCRQHVVLLLLLLHIEVIFLMFMGPCIVRIFQYISNKMQRYTVYFIWKLLYMFRVVPQPIIRSANNCIYSIWYLSHRYCYLPLSWKSWNCR